MIGIMESVVAKQILESKRTELEALCREYVVHRLEVFGSASSESFDPKTSDFDFLVEFGEPPEHIGGVYQYFDFKDELESLYGRKVDLVEIAAVKKQRFFDVIKPQRRLFYAA